MRLGSLISESMQQLLPFSLRHLAHINFALFSPFSCSFEFTVGIAIFRLFNFTRFNGSQPRNQPRPRTLLLLRSHRHTPTHTSHDRIAFHSKKDEGRGRDGAGRGVTIVSFGAHHHCHFRFCVTMSTFLMASFRCAAFRFGFSFRAPNKS